MAEREHGSIRIENVQGTVNLGNIGSNVAFGAHASVAVGQMSPEQVVRIRQAVDQLAVQLAELAHRSGLQEQQIALLAQDLKRVHAAATAERPDEQTFGRAAGDLWAKLMMLGNAVQGVGGLTDGLKLLAGALGWRLTLPG